MGTLYYGDNLDILRRYLKDESVDLVYLDPPFNSAQNYNAFFHEKDGTDADWAGVRPVPGHFLISPSRLPVFAVSEGKVVLPMPGAGGAGSPRLSGPRPRGVVSGSYRGAGGGGRWCLGGHWLSGRGRARL